MDLLQPLSTYVFLLSNYVFSKAELCELFIRKLPLDCNWNSFVPIPINATEYLKLLLNNKMLAIVWSHKLYDINKYC
jgi:hypothetical protein